MGTINTPDREDGLVLVMAGGRRVIEWARADTDDVAERAASIRSHSRESIEPVEAIRRALHPFQATPEAPKTCQYLPLGAKSP